MKNKLLFVLFYFFSVHLTAQTTTISYAASCTSYTLSATDEGAIPTDVGLYTDDGYTGVINIGFPFKFYGTVERQCIVGENGMISFNLNLAGGYDPWPISAPLFGNSEVLNSICGLWCDVDGALLHQAIYTSLQGTAPNRTFAITWCGVAMWNLSACPNQWLTDQIILYESGNIIESHIGHKGDCASWNGGYGICGVQNANGTSAAVPPGENYPTVWTTADIAWRFTPDTTTNPSSYTVSPIPYAALPYRGVIYWYDSSTGAYLGSGSNIVLSNTVTTTYEAALVGCNDDTSRSYVTLPGSVTGGVGPDTASFSDAIHLGCNGDSVFCINGSTPSTSNSYTYTSYWNFGDGSPIDSVDRNPVHVYADGTTRTGTYKIELTYISYSGCVSTDSQTVSFNHPLTASFTSNVDTGCLGTPIIFTNSSTGNDISYLWSFGDGTTDTIKNPTHIYPAIGAYDVVLSVTDTVRCKATANEPIDVYQVTVHTGTHDTSVCLADSMYMHAFASSYGSKGRLNYRWTPSNNLGEPTDSVTKFFGKGNFIYTVTVTSSPSGCTASDTETIFSYPPIQLINLTPSQTIFYGGSVQLNVDGAVYYTWAPNNGSLNDPNINDPIATPVDSITTYTVYGMSTYGCLDSASLTITLDYAYPEFIPSAFTPNGDGLNDIFRVGNLKYGKLIDFRVYNRWGQQMFQTANPEVGWDGTFNGVLQDMGTYNYLISIVHADGTQQTYKGTVTLIR